MHIATNSNRQSMDESLGRGVCPTTFGVEMIHAPVTDRFQYPDRVSAMCNQSGTEKLSDLGMYSIPPSRHSLERPQKPCSSGPCIERDK